MIDSKSETRDGMHIEWDIGIEMSDGVVLRADGIEVDKDAILQRVRELKEGDEGGVRG